VSIKARFFSDFAVFCNIFAESSLGENDQMNYCDPQITLEQTGLWQRHYYFPLATTE
jgi:hypothetical protein